MTRAAGAVQVGADSAPPTSTHSADGIPAPGFADPVRDAQRNFRVILDALARPVRSESLPALPPATLGKLLDPAVAAVALTLCDDSTPVWLDPTLAASPAVIEWLSFHTGAPLVSNQADALFALIADPGSLPPLATFAQGSDEAPHLSTTVIVTRLGLDGGRWVASGPGLKAPSVWDAPALPASFAAEWAENHRGFPRGIDLLFAGDGQLTGLPRTTTLAAVQAATQSEGATPCTSL